MSEKSADHLKQRSENFRREGSKCKDTYLVLCEITFLIAIFGDFFRNI